MLLRYEKLGSRMKEKDKTLEEEREKTNVQKKSGLTNKRLFKIYSKDAPKREKKEGKRDER